MMVGGENEYLLYATHFMSVLIVVNSAIIVTKLEKEPETSGPKLYTAKIFY